MDRIPRLISACCDETKIERIADLRRQRQVARPNKTRGPRSSFAVASLCLAPLGYIARKGIALPRETGPAVHGLTASAHITPERAGVRLCPNLSCQGQGTQGYCCTPPSPPVIVSPPSVSNGVRRPWSKATRDLIPRKRQHSRLRCCLRVESHPRSPAVGHDGSRAPSPSSAKDMGRERPLFMCTKGVRKCGVSLGLATPPTPEKFKTRRGEQRQLRTTIENSHPYIQ